MELTASSLMLFLLPRKYACLVPGVGRNLTEKNLTVKKAYWTKAHLKSGIAEKSSPKKRYCRQKLIADSRFLDFNVPSSPQDLLSRDEPQREMDRETDTGTDRQTYRDRLTN